MNRKLSEIIWKYKYPFLMWYKLKNNQDIYKNVKEYFGTELSNIQKIQS